MLTWNEIAACKTPWRTEKIVLLADFLAIRNYSLAGEEELGRKDRQRI